MASPSIESGCRTAVLNLSDVVDCLAQWSENQARLRKLWVFGSRVKGTAREDSDLDVAFEIYPLVSPEEKDHFQALTLPVWEKELNKLSPWEIHLVPWAGSNTNVAGYVAEQNILVYDRDH